MPALREAVDGDHDGPLKRRFAALETSLAIACDADASEEDAGEATDAANADAQAKDAGKVAKRDAAKPPAKDAGGEACGGAP